MKVINVRHRLVPFSFSDQTGRHQGHGQHPRSGPGKPQGTTLPSDRGRAERHQDQIRPLLPRAEARALGQAGTLRREGEDPPQLRQRPGGRADQVLPEVVHEAELYRRRRGPVGEGPRVAGQGSGRAEATRAGGGEAPQGLLAGGDPLLPGQRRGEAV